MTNTKQIDKVAELSDIEGFFPEGRVTPYLENCYLVTFHEKTNASLSTISYWECNGFDLVEFGLNNNKEMYATFNVSKRRLMRGIVKEVLVVQ